MDWSGNGAPQDRLHHLSIFDVKPGKTIIVTSMLYPYQFWLFLLFQCLCRFSESTQLEPWRGQAEVQKGDCTGWQENSTHLIRGIKNWPILGADQNLLQCESCLEIMNWKSHSFRIFVFGPVDVIPEDMSLALHLTACIGLPSRITLLVQFDLSGSAVIWEDVFKTKH